MWLSKPISKTVRRIIKTGLWLVLLVFVLAVVAGVRWWNYWTSPETQRHRDTIRGKQVLELFERAIDPDKLRAWALPYLSDERPTNNSTIVPPKEISHLIGGHAIQVLESTRTGRRSVCLWLQMGGFGPYERIVVGATNATIETDQSRPSWIQIKWRDGIYYQVSYN